MRTFNKLFKGLMIAILIVHFLPQIIQLLGL